MSAALLYLFIVLLLILFYLGIFLAHGAWLVGDHAEQHYPWAVYLAESLRQGRLPFWTDQIHSGFPLTAEGQIGSFYLPNLFFYFLFPIRQAYAWNIIFHLLLSAGFTLVFMRSLGLERRAAFIGTFIYFFGSTLGGAYYNITSLKVLTWFPLTLFAADKILRAEKIPWKWIGLEGFLFSLELLAGYLQFATYAVIFAGLYFLCRMLDTGFPKKGLQAWAAMALALLFGVLLAFPQLQLTYELALRSTRAQMEEAFVYVGSYSPFALACLLFPSLEGLFVSKLYLGILSLFFIAVSFFIRKKGFIAIYLLALIAFLLALGRFSPVYVLLVKSLHFYAFRTPVKIIFFCGFFLSVLTALGVQACMRREEEPALETGSKTFICFCAVLLGGAAFAYFAFNSFEKPLYQTGEWLVKKFIYGTAGHPFDWGHYERRLSQFIRYAQFILDPRGPVIALPLLKIFAASVLITTFVSRILRPSLFYALSFLLLVVDLQMSYSDIQGDYASYAHFEQKNGVTEFLEKNLRRARYFNYISDYGQPPLPAAQNMLYGLRTANAYSPFVLKDYLDFLNGLGGVNDSIGYRPVQDEFAYDHLNLLGMLNVRYVVTDRNLQNEKLKSVYREGQWSVYENATALGAYFLVSEYHVVSSREALLREAHRPDFKPGTTALLEEEPVFYGVPGEAVSNNIKVIRDEEDSKEFEVSCTGRCLFVLSAIHYPGWIAVVDDREAVSPVRANYILSALPLEKGQHHIRLEYRPWHRFF